MLRTGPAIAIVWLMACGGPTAAPPAPPSGPSTGSAVVPAVPEPPAPPPVLIESEIDSPYVAAAPPAMAETCTGSAKKKSVAPGAGPRRKVYDFTTFEIPAVTYGPRIRDMPPMARLRSPSSLASLVTQRQRVLNRCYRWARWKRHDLAGTMTVTLELDRFGSVSKVDVADRATWGELATCVADAMPAAHARSFVARPTRLTTSITFELSGQGVPAKRPGRPTKAEHPPPPAGCVLAPADPAVDAVSWASPIIKVNDFDETQADIERQQAACKAAGGTKRCRISLTIRDWVVPPVSRTGDIDKATIRSYIRYNLGAFGTCFAEAKARTPALGGEVALVAEIQPDGTSVGVAVESSKSGDATLDECVRAALAEIRFPAAYGGTQVTIHVPFAAAAAPSIPSLAARDTVANIEAAAQAALEAGDAQTALRRYAALAKGAPSCERQVDLLRALTVARPWLDEPVMASAADLVAMAPTGACATAATPVLVKLAIRPHVLGRKTENAELLEIAVERYQLVLRANLPEAEAVRAYLASALISLERKDEATALGVTPAEPRL